MASPLLSKLPAELRNQVYDLVISSDDGDNKIEVNQRNVSSRTALLHTCSQIRREASEMFYGGNTFVIDIDLRRVNSAPEWPNGISAEKSRLLKCIEVNIYYPTARNEVSRADEVLAEAYVEALVRAVSQSPEVRCNNPVKPEAASGSPRSNGLSISAQYVLKSVATRSVHTKVRGANARMAAKLNAVQEAVTKDAGRMHHGLEESTLGS